MVPIILIQFVHLQESAEFAHLSKKQKTKTKTNKNRKVFQIKSKDDINWFPDPIWMNLTGNGNVCDQELNELIMSEWITCMTSVQVITWILDKLWHFGFGRPPLSIPHTMNVF